VYAHDVPHGVARQQYAPDDVAGVRYYTPSGRGAERDIAARLVRIRAILDGSALDGSAQAEG
jgi:putative ATPase